MSTSIILIQLRFETVWFSLVCSFENPNRVQTKTKPPPNRCQTKLWFGSIRSGSWFGPGSKRFKCEPWHPYFPPPTSFHDFIPHRLLPLNLSLVAFMAFRLTSSFIACFFFVGCFPPLILSVA